jgi:glycyl-tRNA synthetase
LTLTDGSTVTIEEAMVERKRIQQTVRGEWYLPHVIEPAFGLDRIIWHLLDHSFEKTEKEGEEYVILHLSEAVAPYEAVVLPLFEKEGMGELAGGLQKQILGLRGVNAYYDGSRSIGRRYARADEIGVPWAITVDHQSVEDGTVTVRRRDDQKQIRTSIDELLSHLNRGTLSTLF